ncbi:MAG: proton-conducting transporter membrane subunit [Victivallaceae bacterium]
MTSLMIPLLLITPLALALTILFVKPLRGLHIYFTLLYSVIHLAASIYLANFHEMYYHYFEADNLNTIFLLVLSVVFIAVAVYSISFFSHKQEEKHVDRSWKYHVFLLLFVDSLDGILLSSHIGMLWVFLEASTLFSAMLIYYYTGKSALEATWKYIFICSIGISFAFIGIILLSIGCIGGSGGEISLFWDSLNNNARLINPFWLKMAFPFLLLGFGTKMGLAPMQNWLPDAYAESPAPATALISATLVNAAFIGVLRVHKVMIMAGLGFYSNTLLMIMGFMSLLIPAVFILRSKNYKRMLAYSSVEHMGIVAIGTSIGGVGLFAALLHTIGHSLVKAAFFLNSGNIFCLFRSKRIKDVTGLLKVSPANAWLWVASFVGICAFPPFVTFISELLIIKELLAKSVILTIIFCVMLTAIIYGIARNVISMISGDPKKPETLDESGIHATGYIPQIVLLGLAVCLGLYIPSFLIDMLNNAVKFMGE